MAAHAAAAAAAAAAASAADAAAAAAHAASEAARWAAMEGALPDEQRIIVEQCVEAATKEQMIRAQQLPADEEARELHELWIKTATPFLKALSDPTRLEIITLLKRRRRLDVGSIAEAIALKPSSTSQQLKRLRDAKLVWDEKERQTVYYAVYAVYLRWKAEQVLKGLRE